MSPLLPSPPSPALLPSLRLSAFPSSAGGASERNTRRRRRRRGRRLREVEQGADVAVFARSNKARTSRSSRGRTDRGRRRLREVDQSADVAVFARSSKARTTELRMAPSSRRRNHIIKSCANSVAVSPSRRSPPSHSLSLSFAEQSGAVAFVSRGQSLCSPPLNIFLVLQKGPQKNETRCFGEFG